MDFTKALKNKVRSAAGAPGRGYAAAKAAFTTGPAMRRSNNDYSFLKDYNAKQKSRVPVSDKEQAQFEGLKEKYSK